jgi:hypothetical protein
MGRFVAKIFDQAGKNSFLRMLWDKTLPHKMRFSIYQWFSLHLHSIDDCRKRTEILINLLEEPGAYNFDKKEQVIKFLKNNKFGLFSPKFFEIWLEKDSVHDRVFNFNGAFLPYETEQGRGVLSQVFADTFLVSLLFNDDYSAGLVEQLDKVLEEGPYGYIADRFDVTVKRGDIVIDAGAWIGDFSAYAAAKGAFSYAFEPTSKIFKVLQEAAELNRGGGGDLSCKKGTWRV